MAYNLSTTCAAEFVGTFLLVFTIGCNVLGQNGTWGPVSIACVLMVTIYAFANVSGSNFNPAVSFALGIMGKLAGGFHQVGAYMATQFLAAACAGFAYKAFFGTGFPVQPTKHMEVGAIICEVMYTFVLVFAVLNTAASKAKGGKNHYFGLAIGFTIVAGGYASGPFGAGCFNPAVALGIFCGGDFQSFGWMFVYMIAEIVGAYAACEVVKTLRPEEVNKNLDPNVRDTDSAAPVTYSLQSKLMSEGIGTYFLVLTVGLNVLGAAKAGAFSIAAALMIMIYSIGDISGGHFNPAVTMAIHWCGKGKRHLATSAQYICAQIVGAILAAFTYALAYNGRTFPLGPGVGHNWPNVAAAELIFTCLLCMTVLFVAVVDDKPAEELIGFIIASCVTVGGFATATISGGCLNPAVAIGIATAHIVNGGLFFKAILYTLAELAGAGVAAGIFQTFQSESSEKEKISA